MLPYTNDDFIVARKLIDAGASAVMPLGAPIGSGMGIQNRRELAHSARTHHRGALDRRRRRRYGFGRSARDGIRRADGVLMNTAIAGAQDSVLMAEAMGAAVDAGRKAFLAGRIEKKLYATASSPLTGVVR